jgi:hypothetical protein
MEQTARSLERCDDGGQADGELGIGLCRFPDTNRPVLSYLSVDIVAE